MYLTRVVLDARTVAKIASEHHLPIATADRGYILHVALAEAFGDAAPQPFRVESAAQEIKIVGYTGRDAESLETAMQLHTTDLSPLPTNAIRDLRSKEIPDEVFSEGLRLHYNLRACPVRRPGSPGSFVNADGETVEYPAGKEIDEYLAVQDGSEPSRNEAYSSWLQRQFEERGGAEIESGELTRFELAKVRRRTGSSEMSTQTKPSIDIEGELLVTEPEQFASVLQSGLGQHKPFGFGMMTIRPA